MTCLTWHSKGFSPRSPECYKAGQHSSFQTGTDNGSVEVNLSWRELVPILTCFFLRKYLEHVYSSPEVAVSSLVLTDGLLVLSLEICSEIFCLLKSSAPKR